eukprot:m.68588 g.68588  ORF g.68588 m.68588 type:complete len:100 (-) comp12202_c0_seq1:2970-3269(-)
MAAATEARLREMRGLASSDRSASGASSVAGSTANETGTIPNSEGAQHEVMEEPSTPLQQKQLSLHAPMKDFILVAEFCEVLGPVELVSVAHSSVFVLVW